MEDVCCTFHSCGVLRLNWSEWGGQESFMGGWVGVVVGVCSGRVGGGGGGFVKWVGGRGRRWNCF